MDEGYHVASHRAEGLASLSIPHRFLSYARSEEDCECLQSVKKRNESEGTFGPFIGNLGLVESLFRNLSVFDSELLIRERT